MSLSAWGTRIKKTFHDPKLDAPEAADEKLSYISQLECVKPEDRVYLDEMGCTANMNLDHGRSRQGERLHDANPTAPGVTVNTAAALTQTGVEAVWTYTGSLNAELFICYLQAYILKLLAGGKVLVMDNHPAHCAKIVTEFLDDCKANYAYLPRYSPKLNPIEEAFSKIKHAVRKSKPRLPGELVSAIRTAIKAVTEDDVISYINHAERVFISN